MVLQTKWEKPVDVCLHVLMHRLCVRAEAHAHTPSTPGILTFTQQKVLKNFFQPSCSLHVLHLSPAHQHLQRATGLQAARGEQRLYFASLPLLFATKSLLLLLNWTMFLLSVEGKV